MGTAFKIKVFYSYLLYSKENHGVTFKAEVSTGLVMWEVVGVTWVLVAGAAKGGKGLLTSSNL